jgi:hypothetical protein
MIELNVVNFIISFGLESLEYHFVFLLADLKLHCIEDGSEPGIGDESTLTLVFILEEWFD